jgi:hypothetical protein
MTMTRRDVYLQLLAAATALPQLDIYICVGCNRRFPCEE